MATSQSQILYALRWAITLDATMMTASDSLELWMMISSSWVNKLYR